MKKILSIAAAILFAGQVANAQTEKGKQNLGLDAFFTTSNYTSNAPLGSSGTNTENDKTTVFRVGPSYGYFVADGSELGGSVFYGYSKGSQSYNSSFGASNYNENKSTSFGATAYFRKYVLYQNKVGFRAGPYAKYQRGEDNFVNTNANTSTGISHTYSVGGTFDLVYYPVSNFGLAASILNLNYAHVKGDTPSQTSYKQDNFTFNFINNGLSLNVFYVFGGK